jgi:hypothetical protein
MTVNSELHKYGDLTHEFHEKYRTTGIALCISLAAVASAEGWWFYGFLKDVKNTCALLQILLYFIAISSAGCIFVSSFVLQFRHYDGMKHMARSYYNLYKLIESEEQEKRKWDEDRKKEWDNATGYFDKADKVIIWLKRLAIINFSSAILYIILYQPYATK